MASGTVTKLEFEQFKKELKQELVRLFQTISASSSTGITKGLKTREVRTLFGCSINKVVSLRVTRKIRAKKIGGTLYYHPDDIKRVLEEGF